MKPLGLWLSGLLVCAHILAATSDVLLWPKRSLAPPFASHPGIPGNVVFDGQHFISPLVQTNGVILLVRIDTNGVVISQASGGVSGANPRLAILGTNSLLVWRDTNTAPARLVSARLSNSVVDSVATITSNAGNSPAAVRSVSQGFLVLWESSDTIPGIWGNWLDMSGTPMNAPFRVSPSSSAQRHPAVNVEGTNYLVCWMEQNVASNDWRVVARRLDESGPLGASMTVSQTNSLQPHATACSFGTNHLVLWSADDGPHRECDFSASVECPGTNLWFAMVYGRMLDLDGNPLGNTLTVIRDRGANTNVTAAFGNGQYVITAGNGAPYPLRFETRSLQPLAADGSRVRHPIPSVPVAELASIAYGAGAFCALYAVNAPVQGLSYVVRPEAIEEPTVRIVRTPTNDMPFSVQILRGSNIWFEYSTNSTTWSYLKYFEQTSGLSPVYFRAADTKWACIENQRSIYWARQQWLLDTRKRNWDIPSESDLFGLDRYLPAKPICPSQGIYSLGDVGNHPTCARHFSQQYPQQ